MTSSVDFLLLLLVPAFLLPARSVAATYPRAPAAVRPDDYFTSVARLGQLWSSRAQLADALIGFADYEASRLDRLRQFAENLRSRDVASLSSADLTNPVDAYVTIRQMGQEWKALLGDCQCDAAYQRVVKSAGIRPPSVDDFNGAADALLRLQDVYGISAAEMSRGRLTLNSAKTSATSVDKDGDGDADKGDLLLTEEDVFHLANRAFNTSMPKIGMDWVRLLLASKAFPADQSGRRVARALDLLQLAVNSSLSQTGSQVGAFLEHTFDKSGGNLSSLQMPNVAKTVSYLRNKPIDLANYKLLCREGSTAKPDSSLKCRLAVPHPFFKLGPIKEELLSSNPRVTFLYDILTDRESSRLMEVADPRLRRAAVGSGSHTRIRISKSAFLPDNFDWSVSRVNKRLGLVTGLNVSDSDPLQLGNYGIGGQYEPHLDSQGVGLEYGNSRIATVLVYLNNVASGGGTVFTRLGLRVMPVRNGALYWYNLRRNSSDIFDTYHAACPVIEGSKWVANKWIYYMGQIKERPCSLSQLE